MSDAPRWLRPSAFPRLAACPASGVESEGQIDAAGDAAALGSAWHEVAEVWVRAGRDAAEAAIPGIAIERQVDGGTLSAWLAGFEDDPPTGDTIHVEERVELVLAGMRVRGTADMLLDHAEAEIAEVVDWKSGAPEYATAGAWLQLEFYAVAAARRFGRKKARATLCYVQQGDHGWASVDVDPAEAMARLERIASKALAQTLATDPAAREYRVGDGCTFCPGRYTCPALNRSLAPFVTGDPPALTVENLGTVSALRKAVERRCKEISDAERRLVEQHGGRLETGDGYALELRTVTMPERTLKATTFQRLQRVKA